LAYGISIDVVDGNYKMGQSTTMKVMKIFVKVVKEIFNTQYVK
jgi:hypothetical protein